jgi:hypothetical protein
VDPLDFAVTDVVEVAQWLVSWVPSASTVRHRPQLLRRPPHRVKMGWQVCRREAVPLVGRYPDPMIVQE